MTASQHEAPQHEQRNTRSSTFIDLDLYIDEPPAPADELFASTAVLLAAQQLVFLPIFNATDHSFYGPNLESDDPRQGKPTVRSGFVTGENFFLNIIVNLNYRTTEIHVTRFSGNGRERRFTRIDATDGITDPQTEAWLLADVFAPVQDAVYSIDPSSDLDL